MGLRHGGLGVSDQKHCEKHCVRHDNDNRGYVTGHNPARQSLARGRQSRLRNRPIYLSPRRVPVVPAGGAVLPGVGRTEAPLDSPNCPALGAVRGPSRPTSPRQPCGAGTRRANWRCASRTGSHQCDRHAAGAVVAGDARCCDPCVRLTPGYDCLASSLSAGWRRERATTSLHQRTGVHSG
jgi:hypothetical protein